MSMESIVRNGLGLPRLARRLIRLAAALALVALWAATPTQAQTGEISGRVVNATTDEAIEGARITVVGTNLSARSRLDGLYNLVGVPIGTHTVRVALIGFSTQEAQVTVQAGLATTVDFALNEARISLDAVVVTGTPLGVSRREVGNSLEQIRFEQIENTPIADLGDILQGRAAGVSVLDNSGMVGTGNTIVLRGTNSITQGNNPLIYVDGIRITNDPFQGDPEPNQAPSPLHDINPEDIDRVEVIKGAAATTLYGTEASAGVIQIFTKRGTQGRPRWTVTIDQGFNTLGHQGPDKSINPTGLGLNNCNFTGNTDFPTGDPMFPADTLGCPSSGSWLQTGHLQRYNVSVRGGGTQINYFLSGRFGREEGVVNPGAGDRDPQGSKDWSVRGNFGFSPSRVFTVTFNNSYARRNIVWIPDGNNAEGLLLNVLRGEAGYTPDDNDGLIQDMRLRQTVNHYTTGLTVAWTPLPGLSHRVNLGLDFAESEYTEERPWGYWRVALGDREGDALKARTLTFDYAGSWTTRLGDDFSSTFSGGGQFFDESRVDLNGFGEDFAGPGDKVLDNAARTEAFESRIGIASGGFFLQEQFGFKDRVYLTAGLRFDGHSAFGERTKLVPYPKLSAAYSISDEAFWPEWWEGFKLRTAWGESGRAPGIFDAVRTWDAVSGDDGKPGVTPRTLGNPDLGPERSREFEYGVEGSMFNGRVSFDFTRYQQTTYDALIAVQQIPSLGFIGTQLENVGEFQNKGIEAQLNLTVLRSPALTWDVGVRYATNKTKVLDIGELQDIYVGWRQRIRPCTTTGAGGTKVLSQESLRQLQNQGIDTVGIDVTDLGFVDKVECPIPGYWHTVVVNDSAPDGFDTPGSTLPGTQPDMEERYLGPSYPPRTLGLNTTIQIGRYITIDAVGEGQFGHVLSSGTAYQNARRRVWPECRDILDRYNADNASINAWEKAKCIRGTTTYGMWIEPADFFKLRSLSVAFRLPQGLIPGTSSATLSLQGRNLLTITDFPGLDPEAFEDGSRGFSLFRQEYYNLPPYRSFIASLRLEF